MIRANGTESNDVVQGFGDSSSENGKEQGEAGADWLVEYGLQTLLDDVTLEREPLTEALELALANMPTEWLQGYAAKTLMDEFHREVGLK